MLQFSLNLRYQDNLVITYLQPGVEYCVSVSVKTFFGTSSVAAEARCAFTSRPPPASGRGTFSGPQEPSRADGLSLCGVFQGPCWGACWGPSAPWPFSSSAASSASAG